MPTGTPFPAYKGDEPYIFVCYAHEDADLVYRELSRLRDAGFNIWYDEGIEPGAEWSAEIAEHIEKCSAFLYFVTPASVEREYCRREINFALDQQCTILHVHLKPTDVPAALKLNLNHRQAILREEMPRKAYAEKLQRALTAALETNPAQSDDALTRETRRRSRAPLMAAVLATLFLSILLGYVWMRGADPADDCKPLTIAIMPFENLSGDPDQEVLGGFLRQQVWQLLSSIDGIGMISNEATVRLAASNSDVRRVVDLLGATYVVEGSYFSADGVTHVSVSLIDANTALDVWSDQFDAVVDSSGAAFDLYSGIATDIVESLPAAIGRKELARFVERLPAESLEVQQLVFQSQHQIVTGFGDPMATIDKALELNPGSSQALATKAIYLSSGPHFGEAERLAKQAISIDGSPMGYIALGRIGFYRDKDLPAAIDNFRKALVLGEIAVVLGDSLLEFLHHAGEWRAGLEAAERRLRYDPDNVLALTRKGRFLSQLGRDEEATATFDSALVRHPQSGDLVFYAFLHFFFTGDLERAKQTAALAPAPWPQTVNAYLAAERGDDQPLLARIEDWKSRNPPFAFLIAMAYFQLGRFEQHLEWAMSEPEVLWQLEESRRIPGYWDKLASWAEGDSARTEILTQYRQHIARQEASLTFHIDPMGFVNDIYAQALRCLGANR